MNSPTSNNQESEKIFDAIGKDRLVRQAIAQESHLMFFHLYFPHYVKFPIAEFQKDIFRITEDMTNPLALIVAFRGSGKSTLVTFSYALWAILGIQKRKFVLLICRTQAQARQHMANLRHELENNKMLRSDLGPFREDNGGEWAMSSLVFKNSDARIMIASIDQSIRGIRHDEHRPDLIILDDVEDLNSTKTIEARSKIFDWFTREVVPLGDLGTRIIIVGNLLHEDSLVMRLKKKIENKELRGTFKWFPLLDDYGNCLWPGKFEDKEMVEELRRSVGNELAWQQEYLLNIVSDSTRVIFPEWIQKYAALPENFAEQARGTFIGVDLAISQKETADYTAIVAGVLHGKGKDLKIYVLPNPVNKRMPYPEVIRMVKNVAAGLKHGGAEPHIAMESNGFQEIYVDQLQWDGLRVEGVKNTSDKRTRLALTSHYVQTGLIQFPESGAEELIVQLTGFGVERHDDLADAFAMMVMGSMQAIQERKGLDSWFDFCESNGGSCWI